MSTASIQQVEPVTPGRWQSFAAGWGHDLYRARRRALLLSALTVIWAIELFVVQSVTLLPANDGGARWRIYAPILRFGIDLFGIGFLCVWLYRRILGSLILLTTPIYILLVTYAFYFQRPLSLLSIVSSWRDGVWVGQYAWDLIPATALITLLAMLVAKFVLLKLASGPAISVARRTQAALVLLAGYLSLVAITCVVDPLSKFRTTCGMGRLGVTRGYLVTWIGEFFYLGDQHLLANAIEQARRQSDALTPIENPIPIRRRLAIVQAETLDGNILGFKFNGEEVTPFLNRLRERSMYFRLRSTHALGSGDSDFTMLSGVFPATNIMNYSLPDFPYDRALPKLLAQSGYTTAAFHGNTGGFYNRRQAFEKMRFDQIVFSEELDARHGFPHDGIGVHDTDVLRLSAHGLRDVGRPTCHFVITLTSHTPYQFLRRDEEQIEPGATALWPRFLNSMRFLDNCLRDYVTSLGDDVTVVIYGDHPTEKRFSLLPSDRDGAKEYVPLIIYDATVDLSLRQRTRDLPVSIDGSLNFLDGVNYLRAQIAAGPKLLGDDVFSE